MWWRQSQPSVVEADLTASGSVKRVWGLFSGGRIKTGPPAAWDGQMDWVQSHAQ